MELIKSDDQAAYGEKMISALRMIDKYFGRKEGALERIAERKILKGCLYKDSPYSSLGTLGRKDWEKRLFFIS